MGISIEELQARHARLVEEREEHAQMARERDLGFAYALGEIELLIALVEQRQATTTAEPVQEEPHHDHTAE